MRAVNLQNSTAQVNVQRQAAAAMSFDLAGAATLIKTHAGLATTLTRKAPRWWAANRTLTIHHLEHAAATGRREQ